MKVSVITAVRNAARDIPATLASVAAQDWADIEHIVVDGDSTDGTADIVRREGKRVARLLSEPDTGVYDAFNKGLRLATGDIIGYLNAGDTYVAPDVLRRVATLFQSGELDAAFADVVIVDPSDTARTLRHYRSDSFVPARLASGFMPAHPTLFISRAAYARCGEYDTSYRIAGDFELCIRLFVEQRARYAYLPDVLVRMPRGGLSNSGWRAKWTITREMRRACRAHGLRTSYARLSARFPAKMLEMLRRDS
jgi:glycosyltransferase involved in cell wall biosynthesis